MIYTGKCITPVGEVLLASDGESLIGLWIEGQKYFFEKQAEERETLPVFKQTRDWLERYFSGKCPDPSELKLAPRGNELRRQVWKILLEIPYGQTITYGEIAKKIAKIRGIEVMSAQAIGGAVSNNPISIIIPCHRVVGKRGNLTGYAGGLDKKVFLLKHEDCDLTKMFLPKKNQDRKSVV